MFSVPIWELFQCAFVSSRALAHCHFETIFSGNLSGVGGASVGVLCVCLRAAYLVQNIVVAEW